MHAMLVAVSFESVHTESSASICLAKHASDKAENDVRREYVPMLNWLPVGCHNGSDVKTDKEILCA